MDRTVSVTRRCICGSCLYLHLQASEWVVLVVPTGVIIADFLFLLPFLHLSPSVSVRCSCWWWAHTVCLIAYRSLCTLNVEFRSV